MAKKGAPSSYTPALADQICDLMSNHGMTLSEICRRDGMPNRSTVLRWTEKNPDFRTKYARAREYLVDFWADQIIQIADDIGGDVKRDALRVDTRKWLMCKLVPRKYGNDVDPEGETGKDKGPPPITINVLPKPEEKK